MQISQAEVIHVRHRMQVPTGPAGVFSELREALLLKLTADDGTVGWGETYTLPGNKSALTDLAAELVGRDPISAPAAQGLPVVDEIGIASAMGAIDTALFDLRGRALGVPVHVLLGGRVRDDVPVYASGFMYARDDPPERAWPREAAGLVDEGYRAMKVRMGLYPVEQELRAMAALRDSLPDDVLVMVDAWGAYTLHEATKVGRRLEQLGVVWFEEPASPYANYAGYEVLTAALDIPVAGGEMGRSLGDFKGLFDRRALDVVQPDIAICGGLRSVMNIAELARLYGIVCVPHSWNGGIMAAATLQVIGALPRTRQVDRVTELHCEYDVTENLLITGLVTNPPELVDGRFAIPTSPGLGIEVDEDFVRRYAVS